MDKLIKLNRSTVITNDGATILEYLDIIHPTTRFLYYAINYLIYVRSKIIITSN